MYVNMQQPVILDSEGDYGMAIYTDSSLVIAGGAWGTGNFGYGQYPELVYMYNDYSVPDGVLLYGNDKARPITATGCLDTSQFKQPNTTYYAFCALVETYKRQPANNTNPLITSLTNVTRYSGVIAVRNNITVRTDYGIGYPITYMEGEVQLSTNAGALVYPPLGLKATPFFYRSSKSSHFPDASDLIYPNASIPIDKSGIIITTARNQTNLFYTNVSIDSTIGQRAESGITQTYFSSFDIFRPTSWRRSSLPAMCHPASTTIRTISSALRMPLRYRSVTSTSTTSTPSKRTCTTICCHPTSSRSASSYRGRPTPPSISCRTSRMPTRWLSCTCVWVCSAPTRRTWTRSAHCRSIS